MTSPSFCHNLSIHSPTEEEERFETPMPQPKQPFNATEKLMKRREHWEHQFNFEFNKKVTDAALESRVANWSFTASRFTQNWKPQITSWQNKSGITLKLMDSTFPPPVTQSHVWIHQRNASIQNWICTPDQLRIANLSTNQKYKSTLQATLTHFLSDDNMRDHKVV